MADGDGKVTIYAVFRDGPAAASGGDAVIRAAVHAATGIDPDEVRVGRRCAGCGSSRHGAPVVSRGRRRLDVAVSMARTDGAVMAVAAVGVPDLGVDLERRGRRLEPGFRDVVLAPSERALAPAPTGDALLAVWVRKEALLKATGMGLAIAPSLIVLDGTRVVAVPPEVGEGSGEAPDAWTIADLDLGTGLCGAVASRTARELEVTLRAPS